MGICSRKNKPLEKRVDYELGRRLSERAKEKDLTYEEPWITGVCKRVYKRGNKVYKRVYNICVWLSTRYSF